jgi:hypothetical protein
LTFTVKHLKARLHPHEERIADDGDALALLGAEGGVEMQVLELIFGLVLGVEVEEHAVDAAAGIGRDAKPVEGHRERDLLVAQAFVYGDVAGVHDGQHGVARAGRLQEAEGMCRVLPRSRLEEPPALDGPHGRRATGRLQQLVGGFVIAQLTQPVRRRAAGELAQYGDVVKPVGCRHDAPPRCE